MNPKLRDKLVKMAELLKDLPKGKNRHLSFLVKKKIILAIGANNYYKTHPLAKHYNYRYNVIHSEFAALCGFKNVKDLPDKCFMVNIRINKFEELKMAKPCKKCQRLLRNFGIQTVYYSTSNGEFESMTVKDYG